MHKMKHKVRLIFKIILPENSEELLTLPMDFTLLVFCNTDGRGKIFQRQFPIKPHQYVRSLRSGKYGYVNDPKIHVSYDSLQEYVETLEHWVKSGDLIAEKEFYSSVRLRGAKKREIYLKRNSIFRISFV